MNLRQMEVFHAIMIAGSVTGAARLLNVTQPTVSTVLKNCEDQLAFKLFNRVGGRLQPTPEADAIYPDIAGIFEKVEVVSGRIQQAARGRSESIAVIGTFSLANGPLAAAAATFLTKRPTCRVAIQSLPRRQVIERVARHEADLGVAFAPIANPGIEAEALARAEIPCILPIDHPLADRPQIAVADLAPYEIITYAPGTAIGTAVELAFAAAGINPSKRIQVDYSLTAFALASRGVGIALVEPSMLAVAGLPTLVSRPLRPRILVETMLLTPKGRVSSKVVQEFTRILRAEMKGG
jgi:DNA-binding transcriptional LysR family regulator